MNWTPRLSLAALIIFGVSACSLVGPKDDNLGKRTFGTQLLQLEQQLQQVHTHLHIQHLHLKILMVMESQVTQLTLMILQL